MRSTAMFWFLKCLYLQGSSLRVQCTTIQGKGPTILFRIHEHLALQTPTHIAHSSPLISQKRGWGSYLHTRFNEFSCIINSVPKFQGVPKRTASKVKRAKKKKRGISVGLFPCQGKMRNIQKNQGSAHCLDINYEPMSQAMTAYYDARTRLPSGCNARYLK